MTVKILKTLCGIGPNDQPFCFREGEIVNVPEYFAADWVKFNYAEETDEQAQYTLEGGIKPKVMQSHNMGGIVPNY